MDQLATDLNLQPENSLSYVEHYCIESVARSGSEQLVITIHLCTRGTHVKVSYVVGNNAQYKLFKAELAELKTLLYNDEDLITSCR